MNKEFTLMDYFSQETGVSEESLRAFLGAPKNRWMTVKCIMDTFHLSKQTAHATIMNFYNQSSKRISPLFLERMIPTIKALKAKGVHIGSSLPTDTDTQVSTETTS